MSLYHIYQIFINMHFVMYNTQTKLLYLIHGMPRCSYKSVTSLSWVSWRQNHHHYNSINNSKHNNITTGIIKISSNIIVLTATISLCWMSPFLCIKLITNLFSFAAVLLHKKMTYLTIQGEFRTREQTEV